MVKRNSQTNDLDRTMYNYKLRTRYGRSTRNPPFYPPQGKPLKSNHVQVAHSNGCCYRSSKKQKKAPLQPVVIQQTPTHRTTAHDISHSRLDPPDPFYYRQGRVVKNPSRTRQPYQNNQIHSTESTSVNMNKSSHSHFQQQQKYQPPPPLSTSTKKSSCCTIL